MKGIIKKIDQINFGLMSPDLIREMSVVNITRPDTYDEDGYPIENGLMDSRLGVIDPSLKCRTCGEKGGECQGHFGMIELARPVIHVGFGDDIHKILRSTCNECGRVLLDDDEIEEITEELKALQKAGESPEDLIKEVYKKCKTRKDKEECPHCGAEQEDIKIVKPIGILEVRKEYDENGEVIKDANGNPVTTDYDLTASEVREKLERISDEDAYVLGVNPEVARPEWMVLTVLPVPPVTVRPSITLDTGERSEDDLTHKLVDVLRMNQRLIENMDAGAPQLIVEDLWQLLQYHVTTYFDNEASGVPPARHKSGRPLATLAQRLKGKEGRFRSNLSGKRVNFSARTVISPDPNISINEVGVPEMIAKETTVPTYVNEWNIDDLKKLILNGPNLFPGANYVRKYNHRIDGYNKVRVLDTNKEMVAENLDYGDIVMRHLKDGDIVLFNRQPSLHRMSMMAHEVRVLPYKTFRLNLCVCPPYNADFDGDEMNMHVFQTDESRAEAKSLMRVQEHILSPRFGGPIIGAIHDHISGAYLLTRDGVEIPEDEAFQMIRKSHLLNNPYVNKKHLKRKYRNWTGKELFSLLLPDDLNMNYRAEICKKCEEGCSFEACEHDAYVVIKDGQLTHGAIDEAAYGSFSGKILDTIVKEYGSSRAKEFLDCSTDLAICGIMKTGITTSTNDEEIPEEAIEVIDAHLDNAEQKVDKMIETYEMGQLQPLPGRSEEETLEMRIVQVLGEARDTAGDIAAGYLTMGKQEADDTYDHVMAMENHSIVMAKTGARGSMLNLAQITACVGQQSVRGERIRRGYLNRPLPHFRKHELGARAKGFVHSSYKEGLDPVEFFFHAMGGREGLVDTAIRTAQSGYMQRRLVNALQDLKVDSTGLVKDNKGQIIQTVFGEDGIDPTKSDFGKVANLDKLIDEMRIKEKDDFTFTSSNSTKKILTNNKSKNKNKNSTSKENIESKTIKSTELKKEKINKTKKGIVSKEKSQKVKILETIQTKDIKTYGMLLSEIPFILKDKTKKYTEISEKFRELENKLDDLEEKEFKKLYLISEDFDAKLKKLILSFNETYNEFNIFPTEITNYERQFKKFKPFNKIKDLSKFDKELSKLEKLSYKINSYTLDKFENNLLEYEIKYSTLLNDFKELENVYQVRLDITEEFIKEKEKLEFELNINSNFKEKLNNLSIKLNDLDRLFSLAYADEIDAIQNNLKEIESYYNSFLINQDNLFKSINDFIDKSKDIYIKEELESESEKIQDLINNNIYLEPIIQDYEYQKDIKYGELIEKEKEFKESYKELYELDIEINYLDKNILKNISEFKKYTYTDMFSNSLRYKNLDAKGIKSVFDNIFADIITGILNGKLEFNSIFEKYAVDYISLNRSDDEEDKKESKIEDSIIQEIEKESELKDNINNETEEDLEFKENHKELYDLGFKHNDFDDESLHYYSKFNEFRNGIVYKFKINNLEDNVIEAINRNIIGDISKKEIKDVNFALTYDNYVELYRNGKLDIESYIFKDNETETIDSDVESFISKEELNEKYPELLDLGFGPSDLDEENLKKYEEFKSYIKKSVFKLNSRSLSLRGSEMEELKEIIITSIIKKEISDDIDFEIFKNYSKLIKNQESDKSIDWDVIIKNNDLNQYDEHIINFSKEKVEMEFKSNEISYNDIENKFKFYLDNKKKENINLKDLQLIINDPNKPPIKHFLTFDEQNLIYSIIQNKITGEGIRGSVYEDVEKEMENRIERNQSDARKALRRFTSNKEEFMGRTGLDKAEMSEYIDEVHLMIKENKILASDINEDFIMGTSNSFKNHKKLLF